MLSHTPCCFHDITVLVFAIWGGAYEAVMLLLGRGLRLSSTALRVASLTYKTPFQLACCHRDGDELTEEELSPARVKILALLKSGYFRRPLPWRVVRMVWLAHRDSESPFHRLPKDLIAAIAKQLIERVPIFAQDADNM